GIVLTVTGDCRARGQSGQYPSAVFGAVRLFRAAAAPVSKQGEPSVASMTCRAVAGGRTTLRRIVATEGFERYAAVPAHRPASARLFFQPAPLEIDRLPLPREPGAAGRRSLVGSVLLLQEMHELVQQDSTCPQVAQGIQPVLQIDDAAGREPAEYRAASVAGALLQLLGRQEKHLRRRLRRRIATQRLDCQQELQDEGLQGCCIHCAYLVPVATLHRYYADVIPPKDVLEPPAGRPACGAFGP